LSSIANPEVPVWEIEHGQAREKVSGNQALIESLTADLLTSAEIFTVMSKASQEHVTHVGVRHAHVPWEAAAKAHRKASNARKLADQTENIAQRIEQAVSPGAGRYGTGDWATWAWSEMVKSSAPLGAPTDISLDAVLSLGFLTKENLTRFAAATPAIEEALFRVCALLVASRLGMREIPESACEAAITALQEVVTGLKAIRSNLIMSASAG
jgi:hypothetical protein